MKRDPNEGISMYELLADGFRTWVRIPPPPPFYSPIEFYKVQKLLEIKELFLFDLSYII